MWEVFYDTLYMLIDSTAGSVRVFSVRQGQETNVMTDRNTLERAQQHDAGSTHDGSSSILGQSSHYVGY